MVKGKVQGLQFSFGACRRNFESSLTLFVST